MITDDLRQRRLAIIREHMDTEVTKEFDATLATNRPSCREAPSFSPPTACRIAVCCAVSEVGTPSTNRRTVCGSAAVPS